MADFDAIDAAFRARAETLVVATTGSTTLEATATGYARAAGSFIDDGFVQGMEVTPTGFAQTATGIVTNVTALALTIKGGRTVAASTVGRTLTVGLPALRAYENLDFAPVNGRPYVEAELVPGPSFLRAGPAQGGTMEDTGLYVVRWYALAMTGAPNIRQCVQALKALFTPHTTMTASGDVVRVRGDVAPTLSPVRQIAGGWALCTLSIPYRVMSANVIAA